MTALPFTESKFRDILKTYPTPFYIYDEASIRANIRRLKKAFSWNPGYQEYFSVKTTPTPAILQLFKDEGCGADCASLTELMLAERCGFSGENIILTSNDTSAEEYKLARMLGALINLDDTGHIEFVEKHAGLPELLCFRINLGEELKHEGQTTVNFLNHKLGSTREQILFAVSRLSSLGMKRFGLHAQFGCHRRDAAYFGENAKRVFQFAVELYKKTGVKVEFVNLAGGLGIPFRPEDSPADIDAVSQSIHEAYTATIEAAGLAPVSLLMELGIYMTGPYGYFAATVLHIKKTYKTFVGLDASTNSFMSPCRYNSYHEITVLGKSPSQPAAYKPYDIVGALCEDRDRFANDRLLPPLQEGDVLIFHDAGAYTYAHSNNFNGKLRPAELLLCKDGRVKKIRRGETPEDYFATMIF